jgi:hypothetical protein
MYGLNRDSGPNLELVKTALDDLLDQAMLENANVAKAEATDPIVFTQGTAENAAKVTAVLGGGGYFEKFVGDNQPIKSAAVLATALRTTLIAEFKKDLPIPRTFMADQQQDAVAKAVNQQTKTWMASRDRNAFAVFANGFTTQTTIDGATLFSTAHTTVNGDTVDNSYTGLLSDGNMNILVNALRQQLAQTGVLLGYEPKALLTPSILHETGTQVCKSVLRAGTGNNDLNYWSEVYPGMKVVYSPFLDSVSTTAYFLLAANHGVYRFEREAFFSTLVPWETDPDDNFKYKLRAREEVDSIEFSGTAASTGTTS